MDFVGKRFGKLIVKEFLCRDKYYTKIYLCVCDCGNECKVNRGNLRSGRQKSCGCLHKEAGKIFKKYNKFEFRDDYVVGYATNTNREFFIDKEDYEKVKDTAWYESNLGYIMNKSQELVLLHRLVTNCPNDKDVDHINHNRMDNRKKNLRICSHTENMRNLKYIDKDNLGNLGIVEIKRNHRKYYVVQMCGKYQGCFKNKEDAIARRNEIFKNDDYYSFYRNSKSYL